MVNYSFPLPAKCYKDSLTYKEYTDICKQQNVEPYDEEKYISFISNAPDIYSVYRIDFDTFKEYNDYCFNNNLYSMIEQHWNDVREKTTRIECSLPLQSVCEFYIDYYNKNHEEQITVKEFCSLVDNYNINTLLFLGVYGISLLYSKYIYKEPVKAKDACVSREEMIDRLRELDPYKRYTSWYSEMKTEELKECLDKEIQFDEDFKYAVRHHKRYVVNLIVGTVLTMTACFWIPFLHGFIESLTEESSMYRDFLSNCISGFGSILTWIYFTGVVSVPLSIVASITLWPIILEYITFPKYNDKEFHKDAYYPEIMKLIKCGNIETTNAIAVLGSLLL